jgi:hypothetical protein
MRRHFLVLLAVAVGASACCLVLDDSSQPPVIVEVPLDDGAEGKAGGPPGQDAGSNPDADEPSSTIGFEAKDNLEAAPGTDGAGESNDKAPPSGKAGEEPKKYNEDFGVE